MLFDVGALTDFGGNIAPPQADSAVFFSAGGCLSGFSADAPRLSSVDIGECKLHGCNVGAQNPSVASSDNGCLSGISADAILSSDVVGKCNPHNANTEGRHSRHTDDALTNKSPVGS